MYLPIYSWYCNIPDINNSANGNPNDTILFFDNKEIVTINIEINITPKRLTAKHEK